MYSGLNARTGAEKWLNKALMKAGKNETVSGETGHKYVSQAEFALIDNLRIMSFLSFMISAVVIKMGRVGKTISWRLTPWLARRTFRKSCFRLVFIAIVALIVRSYAKDSSAIAKKYAGPKVFSAVNKTEESHHNKYNIVKLEQINEFDFEDEEDLDELDF